MKYIYPILMLVGVGGFCDWLLRWTIILFHLVTCNLSKAGKKQPSKNASVHDNNFTGAWSSLTEEGTGPWSEGHIKAPADPAHWWSCIDLQAYRTLHTSGSYIRLTHCTVLHQYTGRVPGEDGTDSFIMFLEDMQSPSACLQAAESRHRPQEEPWWQLDWHWWAILPIIYLLVGQGVDAHAACPTAITTINFSLNATVPTKPSAPIRPNSDYCGSQLHDAQSTWSKLRAGMLKYMYASLITCSLCHLYCT